MGAKEVSRRGKAARLAIMRMRGAIVGGLLLGVLSLGSAPLAAQSPPYQELHRALYPRTQFPREVFQRTLRDIFPDLTNEEQRRLRDEGELTNFYSGMPQLRYRPNITLWDAFEARGLNEEAAVGIEVLFLYALPEGWGQRKDIELTIYNILRSISTMEGILYFSASRGEMRTFYSRSYAIDDPEQRQRIADPLITSIPSFERIHILQEDLSFGENIYSVDYRHRNGSFAAEMVNLTTMNYAIFPIVQPRGVEVVLTIIPSKEGILFYGTSTVEVVTLLGLEERARNSFTNRIRALYNWFREQLAMQLARN